MKIDVKILTPKFYERHGLPEAATPGSAAIDLRFASYQRTTLLPGEVQLLPIGLVFQVPESVVMLLLPRSGLGHSGLILGNSVGVVDPDYRGEVKISVWNRTDEEVFHINPGERIAQALFIPFHPVELNAVDTLSETDRKGGFGHTGRS